MKLKSFFLQPKMFASFAALIIFFVVLFTSISAVPPPKNENISWDEFVKLQSAYLSNNPLLVEYTSPSSTRPVRVPLKGFKLDARMIDQIINHNQNGPSGDDQADSMLIYFGVDGFSGSGASKINNYTVMVAGMKNGVIMRNQKSGNVTESSIIDKADPCPPNCPN